MEQYSSRQARFEGDVGNYDFGPCTPQQLVYRFNDEGLRDVFTSRRNLDERKIDSATANIMLWIRYWLTEQEQKYLVDYIFEREHGKAIKFTITEHEAFIELYRKYFFDPDMGWEEFENYIRKTALKEEEFEMKKIERAAAFESRKRREAIRIQRGGVKSRYELLKEVRLHLANKYNTPPKRIFSDRVLIEIARRHPSTRLEFLNIEWVSEAKFRKYWEEFLRIVKTSASIEGR